jgi:UDP-glucose 4-epimerase
MKILVTGALGHIGSALIRALPEELGDIGSRLRVVLLDNLSTQRYSSLFRLPPSADYDFHEADILQADLLNYIQGCDAVIHLAAITNAAQSFEIREKVEQENFLGTQRVAEACRKTRTPLLFLSSTSVYGTAESEVDENCGEAGLKPQSPYAATKLREENLLNSLGFDGLKFVTLRFGTIFGVSPGMRFHTAVNKFCWQAAMQQPVTVWKTALHQNRPYLDLKDAVRAISFCIRENIFTNDVFNVLTLNASVSNILEAIRFRVPDLRMQLVETQIMNQLSYHVRCEKFQKLGFRFRGDLKAGIFETLELLRRAKLEPAQSISYPVAA